MKIECVALDSFTHDRIDAHIGRPVMIEQRTAEDLERRGLVRIGGQVLRTRGAAVVIADAGKAQDDGPGRPSSVSQPAQASPTETSRSSGRGPARRRQTAT